VWVRTVREVVRTVCGWVSTTITTVKEVVERVCEWLPWPLDAICGWVTKLIEVVETVWEWVCEEVIDRIFEWVEIVLEYVYYILKWVCWLIDWVVRGPEWILCRLGYQPRKFLPVCVKVLTDNSGVPALPLRNVNAIMEDAMRIFQQCNINLVVVSTELLRREDYLDNTTCEFTGLFAGFYRWFSANAGPGCVTVYFVRNIVGTIGCAYPGSDWVTIAANGRGCTVAQEIGHLADLWSHSDTPGNIMTNPCGNDVTENQCCMIRTSRFASLLPPIGLLPIILPDREPINVPEKEVA